MSGDVPLSGGVGILWHNGGWRADDAPLFSIADRVRLGDGIFDTLLCLDGRALHADLHFARLSGAAAMMGLEIGMDLSAFAATAASLLQKNNADRGRYALNTIISRGAGQRGLALPDPASPQVVLRLAPVPDGFAPLAGVVARTVRRNEGSPLSSIKSFNYGDHILALREAAGRGANEAVLLNNAGHVACASAGNIFIIKRGEIMTPPLHDGVLAGVARRLFMQRYDTREISLTEDDLMAADEIFITNSIRGIGFFKTLDGRDYGQNTMGLDTDFHL